MKLRLTEFWVATLLWVFSIYKYLEVAILAGDIHKPYISEMTRLFAEMGLVYDYQLYYFWIRVLLTSSFYLAFVFLNNWVFPKYYPIQKFNYLAFFFCLTFLFLTLAYTLYYRYDNFLYSKSLAQCFVESVKVVFQISLYFSAYTVVKNLVLFYLVEDNKNQTLRIRIIREVLVVFLIWLLILFVLIKSDNGIFGPFWLCIIPCGYFVYAINLYFLILDYGKERAGIRGYIIRLLSVIMLAGILSMIFFQTIEKLPHAMALFTMNFLVLAIAVAFSWFIYSQNKNQLRQLYSLKTELDKSSADIQFLRSQINPHFLFNVLNTLYGTAIQESAERTSEGIQRLGDMMRFMLYENNLDKIPVAREVDYLKDYIHLQNLRLAKSENIKVEVNISEKFCQHSIAPMLLIPFIENAFKHGISLQNRSWINISLSCEDKELELDIYNSMHPKNTMDPEKEHKGIGLENVKHRLELMYPGKYGLIIRQSQIEFFIHLTLRF